MRTPHQLLQQGLDFTEDELKGIFEQFKLAGYLKSPILGPILQETFHIAEEYALPSLKIADDYSADRISAEIFLQHFFAESKYAALLLSLIEFLCQNWFPGVKEIYRTPATEHTTTHAESIVKLGQTMRLGVAATLTERVDLALIIGATSRTTQLYIHDFINLLRKGLISHPMILLSNRRLLKEEESLKKATPDNPQTSTPEFTYNDAAGRDSYIEYLAKSMSALANVTLTCQDMCEGHAVLDRLLLNSPKLQDTINFMALARTLSTSDTCTLHEFLGSSLRFATGTQDSAEFYATVIRVACAQELPRNTVAVNGIAPHLRRLQCQAQAACERAGLVETRVCGFGRQGQVNPVIIMRCVATLVDTQYARAAALIENETHVAALDIRQLRGNTRSTAAQTQPQSFTRHFGSHATGSMLFAPAGAAAAAAAPEAARPPTPGSSS